jgi:hypothetical protein
MTSILDLLRSIRILTTCDFVASTLNSQYYYTTVCQVFQVTDGRGGQVETAACPCGGLLQTPMLSAEYP